MEQMEQMERAALFVCDLQTSSRSLRPDVVQVSKMVVKFARILNIPVCVGEQASKSQTGLI